MTKSYKEVLSDLSPFLGKMRKEMPDAMKGFAAHEEAVYGEIAKARSALLNAQTPSDKIAANDQVTARNVTIAASIVSTIAIIYSIFKK